MYVHMIILIYLEIVFGSAEVYRYHFVYIWILFCLYLDTLLTLTRQQKKTLRSALKKLRLKSQDWVIWDS